MRETGSERSPTLDQVNDQDDDGDDEQNVDETAHRVRADEAEKPEYQQDNKDSPEHRFPSVEFSSASRLGR
jgi:hypothetical protein